MVLATSGPGATNLVTGLADAYMDSVPLVAVTGNVPLAQLGHDSFQEVDIFDVSMPVTKYGIIVKSASEIAPAVRRAFALAESGRRGPVLIDIPSDVLDCSAEYEPAVPERPSPLLPDEEEIKRAAELIARSSRPLIYAGGGAAASRRGGAGSRELALPAQSARGHVLYGHRLLLRPTTRVSSACCPTPTLKAATADAASATSSSRWARASTADTAPSARLHKRRTPALCNSTPTARR